MLILTACYKRIEVFNIFLQYLPNYPLAVIGDEREHYDLLKQLRPDAHWIEYWNQPLGAKWNYGLKISQAWAYDYVMILGSDDIFTPGLWEHYKKAMEPFLDGGHYFGLLDFYFTDFARTKYCPGFQHNRKGEPHGAGRMIHRSILEKLNWELWDNNINSGLDASMTERLKTIPNLKNRSHFFRCKDIGEIALDIKSGGNIQAMEDYDGEWIDTKIIKDAFKFEFASDEKRIKVKIGNFG